MRRWKPQIYVTLASLTVTVGVERAVAQADRTITVNISVKTDTNQPMPDVPLLVIGTGDGVLGHSDAAGDSSIQVQIDEAEDWVYVVVNKISDLGPTNIDVDKAKYNEMRTAYSVDGVYFIEIQPDVDVYQLQITAYPAIIVSGRIVDSQSQPIDTLLWRQGGMEGENILDGTGVFALGGFRIGQAAELLIADENFQWHSVILSAAQTLHDVNLGDIVIESEVLDVTLSGTVTGLQDTRDNRVIGSNWTSIVLVSDDGNRFLEVTVHSGSVICRSYKEHEQPAMIPAGRYYVALGDTSYGAIRTPWMLIDLIRAGRQVELDSAGAVTIDAVAGEPLNVQIDAVAAETAILTVGGG